VPDSLLASHPGIAPLLTDRPQRARLLEAMVQAVAEKGYEAATVADAVRLAKVSRGTFYELFESKEACLLAAFKLGYEVLEGEINLAIREAEDWREELQLGIRAYLQTLENDPLFARVYLIEAEVVWEEREAVLHRPPLRQDVRKVRPPGATGRGAVPARARGSRPGVRAGASQSISQRSRRHPGGLRGAARR
jgi:AcrR family transcriptional regulator